MYVFLLMIMYYCCRKSFAIKLCFSRQEKRRNQALRRKQISANALENMLLQNPQTTV